MLLLDEPTNHLDMDARSSLIDAINDFEGAVVLVSHDTHLVKMVADQLWLVDKGTVQPFDGDIDEYQTKLLRERGGRSGKEDKAARRDRAKAAPPASAKDQRRPAPENRPKRGPLKRALEAAEKDIEKLTQQRNEVETRLADPTTYTAAPTVAAELQKEKIRLERELAHAEHAWLVAQEALEAA
jgi:ATP-binding cassette subfamily F protein 3